MAILQPKESDGDIFSCLLNHTALIAKAGFRLDSTLNDRNWNFSNQGWHLKCHYWFIWEHYASYQSFEGLDETLVSVSVSKRPRSWVKFLVILFFLVLIMLPKEVSDKIFKHFFCSWAFFGHFSRNPGGYSGSILRYGLYSVLCLEMKTIRCLGVVNLGLD